MNYNEIVRAIQHLPLEDKEVLLDDLEGMIQNDIEGIGYQPNHYDEYRKQELKSIIS